MQKMNWCRDTQTENARVTHRCNIFYTQSFSDKLFLVLILVCVGLCIIPLSADDVRDKLHQPEKVMDLVGVVQGMTIGEVGAGHGYFTFKLSLRVGESGKIYANDISRRALKYLRDRCGREGITNIETVIGEVEDPLLPKDLDMVFIVNAFHDLGKPVKLLNNLSLSLKPDALVVILDRDPEKVNHSTDHFLSRDEVLEKIEESVFELERLETFLPQHNIYIIRLKKLQDLNDTKQNLLGNS